MSSQFDSSAMIDSLRRMAEGQADFARLHGLLAGEARALVDWYDQMGACYERDVRR